MISRPSICALSILVVSWFTLDGAEPRSGDLAVIGFHADAPDAFAWVTLVDLDPGLVLLFTDSGWIDGNLADASTVSDGGLRYDVPAEGVPAGKVQLVPLGGPLPEGYSRVFGGFGEMLPGTFGDQLAIVSVVANTFLFALNTNTNGWGTSAPDPNFAAESELYPGLTAGVDAVAVGPGPDPGDEVDNAVYVGISRGTRDELIAAIVDPANWKASDSLIGDITNGTLADGFEVLVGLETFFLRGDCNDDGDTDISDAVCMLRALFGALPVPGCLAALNANGDAAVNISDPTAVLNLLFGAGPVFPQPFPECGPSTLEADAQLGCDTPPASC